MEGLKTSFAYAENSKRAPGIRCTRLLAPFSPTLEIAHRTVFRLHLFQRNHYFSSLLFPRISRASQAAHRPTSRVMETCTCLIAAVGTEPSIINTGAVTVQRSRPPTTVMSSLLALFLQVHVVKCVDGRCSGGKRASFVSSPAHNVVVYYSAAN